MKLVLKILLLPLVFLFIGLGTYFFQTSTPSSLYSKPGGKVTTNTVARVIVPPRPAGVCNLKPVVVNIKKGQRLSDGSLTEIQTKGCKMSSNLERGEIHIMTGSEGVTRARDYKALLRTVKAPNHPRGFRKGDVFNIGGPVASLYLSSSIYGETAGFQYMLCPSDAFAHPGPPGDLRGVCDWRGWRYFLDGSPPQKLSPRTS